MRSGSSQNVCCRPSRRLAHLRPLRPSSGQCTATWRRASRGASDRYASWAGEASAEPNAGGPRRPARGGARRLIPGRERGAEGQGRGARGPTLDDPSREPKPVPGAFSMLDRAERASATKLRTRTRPGHAHTLWYVIFNSPENCSDAACDDDDLHRPEPPLRPVQRAADRRDPGPRWSGEAPERRPTRPDA